MSKTDEQIQTKPRWTIQNIAALVGISGGVIAMVLGVNEYFAKSAELVRTKDALMLELTNNNQLLTTALETAKCKLDEEVRFVSDKADMALVTFKIRDARRDIKKEKKTDEPDEDLIARLKSEIERDLKWVAKTQSYFASMTGKTNCA